MFGRILRIPGILAVLVTLAGTASAQQVSSIGSFSDTLEIGMSARPLGMGRAFAAFSDSVDSAFLNPAGISKVSANSFSTMASTLLQDVNYSVVAAAWPQKERGVFGAGAVLTSVPGITVTNANGVQGQVDSHTNLFFLTYGMRLDQFYKIAPGIVPVALVPGGDLSKIEMGGTLKYFSVDYGVAGGTGSGVDLDLGLMYAYSPAITLALTGKNVLPASWGGQITYDSTGVTDRLSPELKIGSKINLFGLADTAINEGSLPIAIGVDMDVVPGSRNVMHYGAEAMLSPSLAVRAGVDQSFGAAGITQNIAAGIGYSAGDYSFNYAFHPFNGIQEDATHFFSINFLASAVPKLLENILPKISLNVPDKTTVSERLLNVGGEVSNLPDGAEVEINGITTKVKDGKVEPVEVRLRPGKNTIIAKAKGPKGEAIVEKSRVLRLMAFQDIPNDHWALKRIEMAATAGLIEGFPDGTFRPDRDLSRAELSAVIIRNDGSPLPTLTASERVYKDMPGSHWAARYVKVAADKQLVRGYLDNTFRANNPITKAEAVTLAVRYNRLAGAPTFTGPLAENPFMDVPIRHWASRSISDAQNSGMLEYVNSDYFQPNKAITRAEAVEILSKTEQGKLRLNKLMDWNEGY